VAPPGDGEFLVKNDWSSVDPNMRGRMKDVKSEVPPFEFEKSMEGGCVGKVVEFRHPDFQEGDRVLGNLGWREFWKSDGTGVVKFTPTVTRASGFLSGWIADGKIQWEETITAAIENAPDAFIGLFYGDKMGKALVKV
jgi:NADPH-dependent curcumin reductase CurA